ncbi:hypothetical protein TNCV_1652021 [Trichonephila clavipes]|nr:hypothetical protein TNCV_1652021 [Trichonephila clavipes]
MNSWYYVRRVSSTIYLLQYAIEITPVHVPVSTDGPDQQHPRGFTSVTPHSVGGAGRQIHYSPARLLHDAFSAGERTARWR